MNCNTEWINARLNTACKGGHSTIAYDYIKKIGGITGQSRYPYKGWQASQAQVKFSGYTLVPQNNKYELLKAAANQPVAVAIDTTCDAFRFYSSGILSQDCGIKLNHAVNIVGNGTTKGVKYWLVKNSWGANWEGNGYLRIRRESGIPAGICGIATDANYPSV